MKFKNIFLVIVISILSFSVNSQNIQWESANSFGSHAWMYASTFDYDDNLILHAEYIDSPVFTDTTVFCYNCQYNETMAMTSKVDLDGNLLVPTFPMGHILVSDNNNNIYGKSGQAIRKCDNQGNILWTKSILSNNGYQEIGIYSISVSENNSVCVAGVFYSGTMLWVGSDSIPMQDSLQAFAAEIDSAGNVEWIVALQRLHNDYNPNIQFQSSAFDSFGNVYIAWDNSVYKISQGINIWQQLYQDFLIERIMVNNADELFCVGVFFTQTIIIGGYSITNDANYNSDFLMAKISSTNASVVWAKSGTNYSGSSLCTIDQNDNIYIMGGSSGTIYFDSTNIPAGSYLIMFSTFGTIQWVENIFTGTYYLIYDLQLNQNGELLLFGETYNTGNYIFGEDTLNLSGNLFIIAKAIIPSAQMQSQNIALVSGWSMFSTYIDPADNNMDNIFSSIAQNVELVKDGIGNVYWPQYNIDNIDSFTIGLAYQIKMSNQNVLQVSGEQIIPENEIIPFPTGWSMIGYLLDTITSVETYLNAYISDITILKDDLGNTFWPAYNINMIGNLTPGEGYQMKLLNAINFTYVAPQTNIAKSHKQIIKPKYYNIIKNTGSNMTLGIPKAAWVSEPLTGSEIGIFNTNGILCGAGVYTGENLAITIWGDDVTTNLIDGLLDDEEFIIKIRTEDSDLFLQVDSWKEGNEFYKTNKISIIEKISTQYQNSNFQLYQNYPNPFSDKTEISFYIPADVYLEISIYNVLGEQIEQIVARDFTKGSHTVAFEKNDYSAGTYFYKLITPNFAETKLMNIIK